MDPEMHFAVTLTEHIEFRSCECRIQPRIFYHLEMRSLLADLVRNA